MMNKQQHERYAYAHRQLQEVRWRQSYVFMTVLTVICLMMLSGCSSQPCLQPTVSIPAEYVELHPALPEPPETAGNPKALADYTLTVIQHDGELQERLRNLQSFLRSLDKTLRKY